METQQDWSLNGVMTQVKYLKINCVEKKVISLVKSNMSEPPILAVIFANRAIGINGIKI